MHQKSSARKIDQESLGNVGHSVHPLPLLLHSFYTQDFRDISRCVCFYTTEVVLHNTSHLCLSVSCTFAVLGFQTSPASILQPEPTLINTPKSISKDLPLQAECREFHSHAHERSKQRSPEQLDLCHVGDGIEFPSFAAVDPHTFQPKLLDMKNYIENVTDGIGVVQINEQVCV